MDRNGREADVEVELPRRAALYLRISKDDAQTGLAVERQRDECMKVIKREKLKLVETYTDNGVSAYSRNVKRPEFDRMTRDYAAGRFDVVVCWDMDRFSRQPAQLEQWIALGEERGLKISTPTETTDLGTDNGRMFARMKATIARAEVERKSARQKAQVIQAKAAGTFRSGKQAFNDEAVIRTMYRDVLDGLGVYRIARRLNEQGVTTIRGREWTGRAVYGVLSAERNLKFIDRQDWERANVLVRRGVKNGPKEKGLYSGVARCSKCGGAMSASGEHYVCSVATNTPGGSRGHVSIQRGRLEARITEAMIAAFAFAPATVNPVQASVAHLDHEIADAAARKQNVLDVIAKGLVTQREAEGQLRELNKVIGRLEDERSAILAENAVAAMVDGIRRDLLLAPNRAKTDDDMLTGERLWDKAAEVKQRLRERWESLDIDRRRALAKDFIDVRILPKTMPDRVLIRHKIATTLDGDEQGSFFG